MNLVDFCDVIHISLMSIVVKFTFLESCPFCLVYLFEGKVSCLLLFKKCS